MWGASVRGGSKSVSDTLATSTPHCAPGSTTPGRERWRTCRCADMGSSSVDVLRAGGARRRVRLQTTRGGPWLKCPLPLRKAHLLTPGSRLCALWAGWSRTRMTLSRPVAGRVLHGTDPCCAQGSVPALHTRPHPPWPCLTPPAFPHPSFSVLLILLTAPLHAPRRGASFALKTRRNANAL